MDKFPGQRKNEKILYFSRQNPLSFFIINIKNIATIGGISMFIFLIFYFLVNLSIGISILIAIFCFFIGISYLVFLRNKTYFIVTNIRIIKNVKSGIFSEHFKEMKLEQINEKVATKRGFIESLFEIGNVKISGKDKENVIWFKGIKYPKEVVQYISALTEFIKENPNYDYKKLKEFIPRKKRKK